MNENITSSETIVSGNIVATAPAIESFFNDAANEHNWPETITKNPDFVGQIEARRNLIRDTETILKKISTPTISLEQALSEDTVTEQDIINFFSSLSDLLESGLDYERIILYLPFEFIPNATWKPESKELQDSIARFTSAYVAAWENLLSTHDVRANFVDGDVLEPELRKELPMVVKAAHLTPILVQKGILSATHVFDLKEATEDSLLRQNLSEALLVMGEMNLISDEMKPRELPIHTHTEKTDIVTENRRKWLEQRELHKSKPPLSEPQEGFHKLSEPFSRNIEDLATEVQSIREVLEMIQTNEDLSGVIYPVVMISGSRLKGYGNPESDLDFGIFIKPGANTDSRSSVSQKIRKAFSHIRNISDPVEFWLEETEGGLQIKNMAETNSLLGENFQVQFLFGSVWEGEEKTIQLLKQKLLVSYLYETDSTIYGQEARKMYLGELERDTLQYRLMHKGYERFFPAASTENISNSDRIDGQSIFWDSGYRRLATQLFTQRVFLPEIPVNKE